MFNYVRLIFLVRVRRIKLWMKRRVVDHLLLDAPSFLGEEQQEPQLAHLKDEVLSSDAVARSQRRFLIVIVS
jgi:hypothetical protein